MYVQYTTSVTSLSLLSNAIVLKLSLNLFTCSLLLLLSLEPNHQGQTKHCEQGHDKSACIGGGEGGGGGGRGGGRSRGRGEGEGEVRGGGKGGREGDGRGGRGKAGGGDTDTETLAAALHT